MSEAALPWVGVGELGRICSSRRGRAARWKAAAEFVARTFILEAAMELVRLGAGVRQLIVVEDGDQPAGEGHPGEADGRPGGRLLSSSVGGRRLTER